MATEAEFWGRQMPPQGASDVFRARMVREALEAAARDAVDRGKTVLSFQLLSIASDADDATLAKLGRLLKHG